MVLESVLRSAQPCLAGRKIRDAVIGISLLAIELDNGHIGVSYILREDLDPGCSNFPYASSMIGCDAAEIAQWAITGCESLQRAIGVAALNAASRSLALEDCETTDRPFGVQFKKTDNVGMIGHIPPVVRMLAPRVKAVYVFDKAKLQSPVERNDVLPMEEQPCVLPQCDVVIMSGTTVINGSIDSLLEICRGAREIIMIGPSTPMFPEAFVDTGVTVLAGSWWKSENKDLIFKAISLAGGTPFLGHSAIKKTVRVSKEVSCNLH
ncbi:MAG: Rossmann-like domain-containing protein [Bacillota bacterium]|jgi:uncharacterized protein (DUF4213/DUF364 family)